MIYPVKVKDKNGKLKYEISKEACLQEFWKAFGDGVHNEFKGVQVQPELIAKKYQKLECVRNVCANVFQQTSIRHKYCSIECTRAATSERQTRMRKKNKVATPCRGCGKGFLPVGSQRYCGRLVNRKPCVRPVFQRSKKEKKKCRNCKGVFVAINPRMVFCSPDCRKEHFNESKRKKIP